MIRKLIENGFNVTGLDISSRMLELAKQNNPEADFILDDICRWNTSRRFDLIVAWDSIFHLGMSLQKGVVGKLCDLLNTDGILIYSFGDDGDGVPDKVDRCPMEPETLNGVNDSDGSPD